MLNQLRPVRTEPLQRSMQTTEVRHTNVGKNGWYLNDGKPGKLTPDISVLIQSLGNWYLLLIRLLFSVNIFDKHSAILNSRPTVYVPFR